MDLVYKQFVARVAAGRHKTPADIQPLAQGRVWTGSKAKELGLVDDIGGLDAAIADAGKLGKVAPDAELEVYPPTPTLRDVLAGWGQVQAPLGISIAREELRAVEPRVAAEAERLLQIVASFRTTTIQAIAVVPDVR
jgi:protease-4